MLTLEQLMALPKASDVTEVVEVPEWNGTVTIRALSLAQRNEMLMAVSEDDARDTERWNSLVLQAAFVDPVLTYDQAVQIGRLALGPVTRLLDKIWDLSGLTPAGGLSKKAVDDAEAAFRD